MAHMGYLDENSRSFRPDQVLLKKDLVKWLGNAFSNNSNYIPRGSGYNLRTGDIKFYDYGPEQEGYGAIVRAVRIGVI
ncbi:MAG TPA: hypothetical protein DDZ89_09445 [Clostridiales bacterium]|nr:hypothetical protein [Clostridiales bacterium]